MTRERRPAAVLLRMSPQLREGLRAAAEAAGLSLNAFAVQVLAAAAGDPSRFREPAPEPPALRELERDQLGYPVDRRQRQIHIGARTHFIGEMEYALGAEEMVRLVKKYDAEDPGYFVEWAAGQAT
jgi:hypothetical protein